MCYQTKKISFVCDFFRYRAGVFSIEIDIKSKDHLKKLLNIEFPIYKPVLLIVAKIKDLMILKRYDI